MIDFYLAYHGSSKSKADAIASSLENSNYEIEHIPIMGDAGPYLSERLISLKRPILLLVSDNFLKSSICVYNALSVLKSLDKDELIYPIVVEGNYGQGTDNQKVPTEFSKVSDVIGYMNHWRDRFLDARKEKRSFLGTDSEQHTQHIQELRSISSEMGEYLRLLRDVEHIRYEDIVESNFELLHKFLSKQKYVTVRPAKAATPASEVDETIGSIINSIGNSETIEDNVSLLENAENEPAIIETSTETSNSKIEQVIEHKARTAPQSKLTAEDGFIEVKNIELDLSEGFSDEMISDKPLTDIVKPLDISPLPEADLSKKKATIKDAVNADFDHTDEIISDSIEIFEAGQYEAGYLFLEDYLKYNPTNIKVRMHLANMRYDFGDKDKAASDILYILKLDSNHLQAHKWVAEYYEITNNPSKALHHLLKVKALDANSYEIDYRLGILLKNHIKDLKSAKSYFESAIKKNPSDAKSKFQLGIVNKELGNKQEAKEQLKQTLELEQQQPESDHELAKIFLKANDVEKVKHHWKKALIANPNLIDNNISGFLTKEKKKKEKKERLENIRQSIKADEVEQPIVKVDKPEINTDMELLVSEVMKDKKKEPTESPKEKSDAIELVKDKKTMPSDVIKTQKSSKNKVSKKKKKKKKKVKTILITGATAGIGKATAKELASRGHRLILTGRRGDKLEGLSSEIKKSKIQILQFDVRDYDAAKAAIGTLEGKWARIDILINNAGLAQGKDPVHEADIADWNTMIDTNIKGILHMTRIIAPAMAQRGKGHIINVCSTAGYEVYPGGSVYCASKHAVRALTKGMRMDLHKYNIRISQVSPGAVEETEFAKVRFHGDEERAKIYDDFTPVNSRDIAKIIRYVITRPKRVNIEDVLVMGTQQAAAMVVDRSGRKNG